MKAKFALCLLTHCHAADARERLRISEVTDSPAGEGVETLTLEVGGKREMIHVKKEAIITEADVRGAWPDSGGTPAVLVQLNDAGAEKMARATSRIGQRLAIIVDGVAITAPRVQSAFSESFQITMGEAKPDDLSRIAAAISGRPVKSPPAKSAPAPLSPPVPSLLKPFVSPDAPPMEVDPVGHLEEIRIPDLNQPCSEADLAEVGGMFANVEKFLNSKKVRVPSIDANCDTINLLALHVPAVADLCKSPEKGRIPLAKLAEKLLPNTTGPEPVPVRPPAK